MRLKRVTFSERKFDDTPVLRKNSDYITSMLIKFLK